jgi:hypothetical protein
VSSITSASTVGFPRESITWRPSTNSMMLTCGESIEVSFLRLAEPDCWPQERWGYWMPPRLPSHSRNSAS